MTPGLSYYWEGAREQCEDSKWDEEKIQYHGRKYHGDESDPSPDLRPCQFLRLTFASDARTAVGHFSANARRSHFV